MNKHTKALNAQANAKHNSKAKSNSKVKKASATAVEEKIAAPEEKSGNAAPDAVQSSQSQATAIPPTASIAPNDKEQNMTLTLKGLDKRGRNAIYTGAAIGLRIGINAFPGKTAPASIDVADGVFAVKAEKAARVKLTKEERAALPKKTLAERVALAEKRAADLKTKLAASGASL